MYAPMSKGSRGDRRLPNAVPKLAEPFQRIIDEVNSAVAVAKDGSLRNLSIIRTSMSRDV
jgi:hypothetical protein